MPNLYASEAEAPRILAIQRDIFARLVALLCSARSATCLVSAGALYQSMEVEPGLRRNCRYSQNPTAFVMFGKEYYKSVI